MDASTAVTISQAFMYGMTAGVSLAIAAWGMFGVVVSRRDP